MATGGESSKRVQKKYSMEFKLKIVAEAKRTSGEATARKHNVDPRRIRAWKGQIEELGKLIFNIAIFCSLVFLVCGMVHSTLG